uniref:Cellulose synthase n=1 Tax=Rhizophora mucronata TaxID=61149 RepID=A0A2P2MR54_RHIMU
MIPYVITRPRSSILHRPTIFWDFLCRGNQSIYFNFELFILSLYKQCNMNKLASVIYMTYCLHNLFYKNELDQFTCTIC